MMLLLLVHLVLWALGYDSIARTLSVLVEISVAGVQNPLKNGKIMHLIVTLKCRFLQKTEAIINQPFSRIKCATEKKKKSMSLSIWSVVDYDNHMHACTRWVCLLLPLCYHLFRSYFYSSFMSSHPSPELFLLHLNNLMLPASLSLSLSLSLSFHSSLIATVFYDFMISSVSRFSGFFLFNFIRFLLFSTSLSSFV